VTKTELDLIRAGAAALAAELRIRGTRAAVLDVYARGLRLVGATPDETKVAVNDLRLRLSHPEG